MPPKSTPWPAPTARGPVDATVSVPGSKSVTNRALVLAALADAPSVVRRPLRARDTDLMAAALRSLGVAVVDTPKGHWAVTPPKRLTGPAHIDCGLAGTVMRFVPPVAALAKGDVRFDGDPRARVRPMSGIITALEALGVRIDDDGRGTLPFTVRGTGRVPGGAVELDASSSSQFISALLLAAPRFEQGARIRHRGRKLPSMPHIAMSVAMLREQGVAVTASVDDPTDCSWEVRPGPIRGVDRRVEPDLSNAAPFLAAAMVTAGTVRVPGWPPSTTQAGDALRDLLTQFGGRVSLDDEGLMVRGPERLQGIDADLRDVGELTPVLAALAALAATPSRLRGIGHLRGHETDRLAALATEINRLGGEVGEKSNGLRIRPRPLHGGIVETYDDHRMATAAAVLGLVVPGIQVRDVATTAKTLPGFVDMWRGMLRGGETGAA